MNTREIKKRIAMLLGNAYSFASYKTTEGTELKTEGDAFEVGQNIYVITPQGELPAEDGEYELENKMVVKVKDGLIAELTDNSTEEEPIVEVEVEMVDATLVDGTKVTTDGEFEVGKQLYVITEDGTKVIAPEGEHVTESGIQLVVDADGFITGVTHPDQKPEGSVEGEMSAEELLSAFEDTLKNLMGEIQDIKKTQEELKNKFEKFSAEPASEKHYDRNSFLHDFNTHKFDKLQAISQLKSKK